MPAVGPDDGVDRLGSRGIHGHARASELGAMTVQFERWKKGADPTMLFAGLPGGMCQAHHFGYLISGRLAFRTAEGEEIVHAGQAYAVGPGHIPVALEDCMLVEFTASDELRRTVEHVERALAAAIPDDRPKARADADPQ
jgi:hypothetical protein